MVKLCNTCDHEKPLTEFYAQPGNSDGRAGRCKECHKERMSKRRADNLEAVQAYDRERGQLSHRKQAGSALRFTRQKSPHKGIKQ